VGYERRNNDALRFSDGDRFAAYMQDDQPVKPANILSIVATNQGTRDLTRTRPTAQPLSPVQVQELMVEGHVVVDARSSAAFGAGHIQHSINAQQSSSEFEQRVGWVVPDGTPIILVTETEAEAQQCIYDMAFIALDRFVTGYLAGGIGAWMSAGLPLRTVPQIDVASLHRRLQTSELKVLDVRGGDEWDAGHIQGAAFMPYTSMARQLDVPAQLDQLPLGHEDRIAVTCAGGFRSSTAISLMLRHGYRNLINVTGGMETWKNASLPTVT